MIFHKMRPKREHNGNEADKNKHRDENPFHNAFLKREENASPQGIDRNNSDDQYGWR
jgi:hypothetical protein